MEPHTPSLYGQIYPSSYETAINMGMYNVLQSEIVIWAPSEKNIKL
jgi:hypothetical protein